MKDFPVFVTEFGAASLILREVPYRQEAYIHIRDTQPGELPRLLQVCGDFCRAVGAEDIYATGHGDLEAFPLYTAVYEMRCSVGSMTPAAERQPVTRNTVGCWRQICNQRMRGVANAATLTARDEEALIASDACFVRNAGELLGLGWLKDGTLMALAAVKPGSGETVLRTLLAAEAAREIRLEVASRNRKAIALYEKCGFTVTRELRRWYRVGQIRENDK